MISTGGQSVVATEPGIGAAVGSLRGAAANADVPQTIVSVHQSAATIEPGVGTAKKRAHLKLCIHAV